VRCRSRQAFGSGTILCATVLAAAMAVGQRRTARMWGSQVQAPDAAEARADGMPLEVADAAPADSARRVDTTSQSTLSRQEDKFDAKTPGHVKQYSVRLKNAKGWYSPPISPMTGTGPECILFSTLVPVHRPLTRSGPLLGPQRESCPGQVADTHVALYIPLVPPMLICIVHLVPRRRSPGRRCKARDAKGVVAEKRVP
jgi:hypothetical protein